MSEIFGAGYATSYDLVYGDKDYGAECELLERAFERFAMAPVRSVLDLGCGTGNHALPLAERGHEVVGVDRSPGMLAAAAAKLEVGTAGNRLELVEGDLRALDLGRRFDAVLMMFAVLGYQLENGDVIAALETVRRHLAPGGLFAFDVWYGPAVLHQRPGPRVRVIPTRDGRLLRSSSGELDVRRHRCSVRLDLWRLAGDALVEETHETHEMRFFFPLELELLLGGAGLELTHLSAFPTLEQPADESAWNVFGVARAKQR